MAAMYLDALEFLEEEREAWAPFEALGALSDDQLAVPLEAAHGWSGRQLIGHLLHWQGHALEVAKELAVNETSAAKESLYEEWARRGGDVVNADADARWAAKSMTEIRDTFRSQPGELRGYLTVVPETRWLKNADYLAFLREELTEHYEDHRADLEAVLAAARG
jgi:hypothetical protein